MTATSAWTAYQDAQARANAAASAALRAGDVAADVQAELAAADAEIAYGAYEDAQAELEV